MGVAPEGSGELKEGPGPETTKKNKDTISIYLYMLKILNKMNHKYTFY